MSKPRMVFAHTTYLITRTTLGRRFLLKPGITNDVFLFCLFAAAAKHGVLIHCVSVESNHFHAVVSDTKGELSDFMHWLDSMVARNLLVHYEQSHPHEHLDGIWSKDKFSAVVLATPEKVIDALVYVPTNPVKDGLVSDYRQWPGLNSRPGDWMKPKRRARRPRGLYFSDKDPELRWVDVQYTVPPMFADRDVETFVDSINAMIRDVTKGVLSTMSREGRTFLGVKGVLAVDPFAAPDTPRVKGTRNPCFAAADPKVLNECLTLLRNFRQRYREAWLQLRDNVKDVVFPAGTYLLRVRFNVACDTLHPPWCFTAS